MEVAVATTGAEAGRSRRAGSRATRNHQIAPAPGDDPQNLLALLEAVAGDDSAEVFRRALEREMVGLITRSLRLRADLALPLAVANPILAEALASARAEFDAPPTTTPWRR